MRDSTFLSKVKKGSVCRIIKPIHSPFIDITIKYSLGNTFKVTEVDESRKQITAVPLNFTSPYTCELFYSLPFHEWDDFMEVVEDEEEII